MAESRRDLAMESMYEFGSRVGVWRALRLLAERELPATVFGCALALERNPAVAKAIAASGHDVCLHGWRWVEAFRIENHPPPAAPAARGGGDEEGGRR